MNIIAQNPEEQDIICRAVEAMYDQLGTVLDERQRRLFLSAGSVVGGRGAATRLHDTTGVALSTLSRGRDELSHLPSGKENFRSTATDYRARKQGGGRKKLETAFAGMLPQINQDRQNNKEKVKVTNHNDSNTSESSESSGDQNEDGPR